MSEKMSMSQATYYNDEFNTWGFVGCECDAYESQESAYHAYIQTIES